VVGDGVAAVAADRGRPGRPGRGWALAFLVFFLISAAWAMASPYDGTPDEVRHIIRAAGVVQGQIFPRPATEPGVGNVGAYQSVPTGLVRGTEPPVLTNRYCYHWIPSRSAACAPVPGDAKDPARLVTVVTAAGRYNPLYYAVVGEPLVRWPDWTGILLARLISAALCAAFLASAWLSCLEWGRSRLLIAGLLVAATPPFFELSGGINPNSVEIAAGISLAAAAVPLLLDTGSVRVQGWRRRAAVAAIGIGQFRAMGPELIAGLLIVLLLPPVRARLRQLLRQAATWWWSAAVLVSCALGVAWTVISQVGDVGNTAHLRLSPFRVLRVEFTGWLTKVIAQMIDGFSYYDTNPPHLIIWVWAAALGALLVAAVICGNWADRWRLAALAGGTLAIPVVFELLTVNSFGFSFQGRYILPLAVGIPVLAAFIIGSSGRLSRAPQTAIIRAMILLLLPVQLLSLGYVMDRFQSGVGPGHALDPLLGSWHPVTGSVLPLAAMTAGLISLGVMAWREARLPDELRLPLFSYPAAEPQREPVRKFPP
jgi:predicted membrane protein DUF2142